ncbi:hypothetical protein GCM10027294_20090 [Marinactinospora endophytica]
MRARALLQRRLADPRGLLTGAIAGGLAWAVGVPLLASVAVAAIVWLTWVLVLGYLFPEEPPNRGAAVPAGPEADAVHRARRVAGEVARSARRAEAAGPDVPAAFASVVAAVERLAATSHLVGLRLDAADHPPHHRFRHEEVRHRLAATVLGLERLLALLSEADGEHGRSTVEAVMAELGELGHGVAATDQIAAGILRELPPEHSDPADR